MPWNEKRCEEDMAKCLVFFEHSLSGIRTGRANPGLIENVAVEAYGQKMKLIQVGSIDITGDRILTVRPFDKSITQQLEKALKAANLGLSCSSDGFSVVVKIPRMTEEVRKEMVKTVKKMAEDAKVSIRNKRRDEIDYIKSLTKEKTISEDEERRISEKVKKITVSFTTKIDTVTNAKIESLMSV